MTELSYKYLKAREALNIADDPTKILALERKLSRIREDRDTYRSNTYRAEKEL